MMIKTLFMLICSVTIFLQTISAQEKTDLNGQWQFKTDPYAKGETEAWFSPETASCSWDSMEVPGNWDLHNEYSEYAGDAWYSRVFDVPGTWENKEVRLVFQSVYNDCVIWLNGEKAGENHLGFLPFHIDISKYLNFGEKNRLTVKVNNVFKRGAIWNWGGIRRPVWMEVTEPFRLEYQHITAVPDLKKGTAGIDIKIACSNKTAQAVPVTIDIKIEREGKLVTTKKIETVIPAGASEFESSWSTVLKKADVDLWHFDFPKLYTCAISLFNQDKLVNTLSDRFGIRKLEVSGMKLLLNGEEIRPVGFNVVPEDRMTGNTLPVERIREDVDMMKELGVNMCRVSHLPLPKEYLDYLDEKGIMTFEEVSLWGKDIWVDPFAPMPKEWLNRMIKEKYNHPSVIGWSVGNEIGYLNANPKVMEYVKGAIEMAKALDPNRLAVYISHSANNQDTDPVEYSDLCLQNTYGGWGNVVQKAWEKHGKPVFVSEFGHVLNNEDPNLGIINAAEMMEQFRGREYLLGVSLWTFNDYRSSYYGREGWATPVSQNRCWGIVNTFRQKKRGYYDFKKEYSPVKELTINLPGPKSETARVTITPRAKFDIPANILRGYKLRWSVADQDYSPRNCGEKILKTIKPGDDLFVETIQWEGFRDIAGLKAELVDPQGYSVSDQEIWLKAPERPQITFVNTAQNGVRISYEPSKGASGYVVRYQHGDEVFYSDTTINQFVTITDDRIKQNEPWEYEVIAINDAGASTPSEKITAAKDEDELPPVVWAARRVSDKIFIGFSSLPDDYLYEAEYGEAPGAYQHQLGFKNKGVASIPGVQPGKPVYLRLRCRKQWGFASEWTQEIRVE